MADRFLIAPLNVGLQTDLRPWLVADQAFTTLVNAYYFRGRIRKRFGSEYMTPSNGTTDGLEQLPSRLGVPLGVIPGGGTLTGTVPGATFAVGQLFSVGPDLFTVVTAGAAQPLLVTNAATSGTFDTTNGNFSITDAGQIGTDVIWYPATPVMGIMTYQTGTVNDQPTIAFDTQFAYQFTADGWQRIGSSTTAPAAGIWSGSDSQFFWGANYQATSSSATFLFVTNFNPPDLMQYWDGANWHIFNPAFNVTAGNTIQTARIIVPFKNRLVLLNTVENNSVLGNGLSFQNRARYSMVGDATNTQAFYDDANAANFKGGGFLDNLQTQEAIISAEFIKDRLIVFYERSTWELAYTGNQQLPFVWQQINTELGAESTFSSIPFDKQILTIGNVGVHACNGANVERIDNKIPTTVFQIQEDNNGVLRTAGIRDYYTEVAYWTYPDGSQSNPNADVYPNRILVYNYKADTWSLTADSFTAFGYFDQQSDLTWATAHFTWAEAEMTWGSGQNQGQFRQVIAGNQEGYILILNSDLARNAGALQITNIDISTPGLAVLTIINHNISVIEQAEDSQEFLLIENVQGSGTITNLHFGIFPVVSTGASTVTIDVSSFPPLTGTYSGAGTAARVSNINIISKDWNPYDKQGKNIRINKIDFLVDKTTFGEVTVDWTPSSIGPEYNILNNSVPGVIMGDGVLETHPYPAPFYPLEAYQKRLWHSIYPQIDGECIQIRIYMTPAQMVLSAISLSDFELHAILLYANAVGRLE